MVKCICPWTQLGTLNSNVVVCCAQRKFLGNVKKFQTLEEAWNGVAIREFRQRTLQGDIDELCPGCLPRINQYHLLDDFYAPNNPDDPRYVIKTVIEKGEVIVPVAPLITESTFLGNSAATHFIKNGKLSSEFDFCLKGLPHYTSASILFTEKPFAERKILDFLSASASNPPPYRFAFMTPIDYVPFHLLEGLKVEWRGIYINGATKSTYEAFHDGPWEAALGNLQKIIALEGRSKEHFDIAIHFTVTSLNFHEISLAVELFEKFKLPVYFVMKKRNGLPMDLPERPKIQKQMIHCVLESLEKAHFLKTQRSLVMLLRFLRRIAKSKNVLALLDVSLKNFENAESHLRMGTRYHDQNKPLQALKEFHSFLQTFPNNLEVYINLGWTYFALGEFSKSEQAFKIAIENTPNFSSYNGLGFCYAQQGKIANALEAYEEALKYFTDENSRTELKSRMNKLQLTGTL